MTLLLIEGAYLAVIVWVLCLAKASADRERTWHRTWERHK
jgi:hypothetical protein